MAGEKVEVTQKAATDDSIREFQNFRDSMQGEGYQSGGRFESSDRGFGSGTNDAVQETADAAQPYERPAEDGFNPNASFGENITTDVGSTAVEDPAKWQKMYGQSENEKGEWRKTATEALGELAQLKKELETIRNAQANSAYQTGAPPYAGQAAAGQQASAQAQSVLETFFPDKSDDDLIEVKDVNAALRNYVAPAVLALEQQQRMLYQQQVYAMKSAAGLTPDIEQRVLGQHPWLQNIPDGPARIQAIRELVEVRKQPEQRQQQQAQPQQAQVNPAQAAARRVTYVESGRPGSAQPAEDGRPLIERVSQELAEARRTGGAAAMRKVLSKYGMNQVNDWGPDVWGPAR